MKEIIEARLRTIKEEQLFRQIPSYTPLDATHRMFEGKSYLMMASNDYLGFSFHERVIEAALAMTKTYGTGSGGARLLSGTHSAFREIEERLSKGKEKEKTLIYNTGYMANVGVISALIGKNDIIFSDALNHASIIDGARLSRGKTLIYSHNNYEELERMIKETPSSGLRLIITEGVFSMDGDTADLERIVYIGEKYNCFIMVDDAHGMGTRGHHGWGSAHEAGLSSRIDIHIGTLSKALGSVGGFACTDSILYDYLCSRSRSFIFSTALSPGNIGAASMALRLLDEEPYWVERLKENITHMNQALELQGISVRSKTPIFPILVGSAEKALSISEKLWEEGIILSAIRPPTVPENACRLRLTVTARHTKEELTMVAEQIGRIYSSM